MPKKSKPAKCPHGGRAQTPLYKEKSPEGISSALRAEIEPQAQHYNDDLPRAHVITAAPFELREDGSIIPAAQDPLPAGEGIVNPTRRKTEDVSIRQTTAKISLSPEGEGRDEGGNGGHPQGLPELTFSSDTPFVRLYHGNCLELLDAIAAKYPEGRFDATFADPPYFLSNGGITCHAGKMVRVDKGDWDKSHGPELNHEFNLEWLARCQRVLKPNGTIWVSGTQHVIFSIGYAMQQLGYKVLNDIAWEKPNPQPNLSCRYFTHSTETILWAAKNEKSKHVFNYQEMRKVTGKQMKTVWWKNEFEQQSNEATKEEAELSSFVPSLLNPIWTMTAPGGDEKAHGKHPTQKPVALIERCLLASIHASDLVLDPFLGGGTTGVASIKLNRGCVGVEADLTYVSIATKRADKEIVLIWLRHFRIRVEILICGRDSVSLPQIEMGRRHANPPNQIDLDLFSKTINGSRVDDKPELPTESIYHETKFVFLSCAEVQRGSMVHTTIDVSLQEAWAKTPNGKKRETTHVVRCETEIFRVKSS